jgi:SNF2 family DNA or RNA helicase
MARAFTTATELLFKHISLNVADRMKVTLNNDATKFHLHLWQDNSWPGGNPLHPSYSSCKTFISRIPERKKLDSASAIELWEVAATDITAAIIASTWPADKVTFTNEAAIVNDYLLATFDAQVKNAENFAAWKTEKKVPEHNWEMADGDLVLSPAQQVALCGVMDSEAYALFMEQGCGKTPVVIAASCNMAKQIRKDHKRPMRVIIAMPKNVRMNWEKEYAKFATCSHTVGVLRGGEIDRTKIILETLADTSVDLQVIVCGYDSVVNTWKLLKAIPWDLGVLDESHYIKRPETSRAKYCWRLRDQCDKRLVLTGTPITNHHLDLYSQLEFLGKGWSGFMAWKNFKSFYGVYEKDQDTGRSALVAAQNLPFMQERLARSSFIITLKEAAPYLPDKVYDIIEVEMSGEQKEVYDSLRTTLAAEIKRDMEDASKNKMIMVQSVLTKLLRLAQVTSGFIGHSAILNDDGEVVEPKSVDRFDPNPKLEALVEEMKSKPPGSKTLIWACWVQDIKTIRARLEYEGLRGVIFYGGTNDEDRIEAERAFNEDFDCCYFLANPAAGGTGLNLLGYPPGQGEDYETNCDHEIYYSQNWSPTARSQSEARAHRRGTRQPVRITDLCVPNTIDEEIRTRVLEKRLNAATIADLRGLLSNIFKGVIGDYDAA